MNLPRIKLEHNPVRISDNRIRIGTIQFGVASEIEDDDEGTIWRLMELMDGTRSEAEIAEAMQTSSPDLDPSSIREAIDDLIAGGFVEDSDADLPEELSKQEMERYSRSAAYFSWVDTKARTSKYEIQAKLKQARVSLLGLGGSGSAVAMSLVASGIGSLLCVDFDQVELSNLNRQLLFTEKDVNKPKITRALSRLHAMNADIQITGMELRAESVEDIVPLMKDRDLFILCADRPQDLILEWVNQASVQTQTPWMMCLYAGPMAVVGIFAPPRTPCFDCLMHDEEDKNIVRDGPDPKNLYDLPGANAVIASTASLTGHFGALEAIYYLGDLEPQTLGRILHQNLMIYDQVYYLEPPIWNECPACGPLHKQ